MTTELVSVATSLPPWCVAAAETKERLHAYLDEPRAVRWGRMVDATRVKRRYVVMPVDDLLRLDTTQSRNAHYVPHALAMGEDVAGRALAASGATREAVKALVSISCTGYMMPSLDAHLIGRLGLPADARRVPITELGCSAGVGAMGIGTTLLGRSPDRVALVVSVELSSLGVQVAEPSTTDMVANLLFGDAAAAAVLSSQGSGRGPLVVASGSVLWEGSVDHLGMHLTDFGFRLFLSPALPRLVHSRLPGSLSAFLGAHGLTCEDIRFWVIHPGGPKILDAVASSLGLPDRALQPTWDVWEQHGNLSSATVFFILKRLQEVAPPAAGDLGLMLAFGPGITCEMVLLRSQGWLSAAPSVA